MNISEIKNHDGKVIFTYDEDDEKLSWGKFDLSGVDLQKADLFGAIWQDVILRGANLKEAEFQLGNLFMSDLSETNCEGIKFLGTTLDEVNFTKANLMNAVFGKSNIGIYTKIYGANFTDAILEGAKFDGTLYDEETIFPKNFNPEKNGLVCIKGKKVFL